MKHIKLPLEMKDETELKDIEYDTEFDAIVLCDKEEIVAYVPTDLKLNPDQIAEEIVQACNAHDALTKIAESADEVSQLIWDKYGNDIPPEFVVALMELDRKLGEIAKTEGNHD